MDTLGLRLAAVAAGQIAGFQPALWAPLEDERGPRVLVSDEDRSVVVALIAPGDVPAAQTEAVACAVLRSLLPDAAPAFPQTLATLPAPKDLGAEHADHEVHISDPLPGTPTTVEDFTAGSDVVAALADFLADLHNSDAGALADAGLVTHDSAELRDDLLADLDRAAGTGHVPAVLLQRWEDALENVSTWRFLPCPIHGALAPEAIRVSEGRIVAISDFFRLRVGDPAADLAAVSTFVEGEAFDAFLDRYRRQRATKDAGLKHRAELLAELAVLDWLLLAVDAEDEAALEEATELLEALGALAAADEQSAAPAQPYAFDDRDDELPTAPEASAGSAGAVPEASAESADDASPADGAREPGGAAAGGPAQPRTGRTPTGSTAMSTGRFVPQAPLIDEDSAGEVPTERILGEDDADPAGR